VRFDGTFRDFREVVARVVVECHIRAFAGEDFAESRADAACAAGNEGAFVFKK